MSHKVTLADVMEYKHLFTIAPAFVLGAMARRNSNLVQKFKPSVLEYMGELTDDQKRKLAVILTSDIDDLQAVMREAHRKTGKKQYKILADPSNRDFIEKNLSELRKLI